MKRYFAFALILVLLAAFSGCMAPDDYAATEVVQGGGSTTAATTESGRGNGIFQLIVAVYLLYMAIRGKGKLFDNKYTKCPYEKYRLIMRLLCALSAVLMASGCILELTGVIPPNSTLSWVLWGLGFASLIAILVFNIAMTDRKAAMAAMQAEQEAKASGAGAAKDDPLRGAFVFDDEEGEEAAGAEGQTGKPDKAGPSAEAPRRDAREAAETAETKFTYNNDSATMRAAFEFDEKEVAAGEFKKGGA